MAGVFLHTENDNRSQARKTQHSEESFIHSNSYLYAFLVQESFYLIDFLLLGGRV
jgi:hypothetical protein